MLHPMLPRVLFTLAVAGLASAQERGPQEARTTLAAAQRTFAAADRDGDGAVDRLEALAATIPPADFAAQDADDDGRLGLDEFLVYYERLLLRSGRSAGGDLRREARRIALQRERAADARGRATPPKAVAGVDVDVPRRLAAAREALARAGSSERRTRDGGAARAVLEGERDAAARLVRARALLDARARGGQPAAPPSPQVGAEVLERVPARLEAARRALEQAERRRSDGPRGSARLDEPAGAAPALASKVARAEAALLARARRGDMDRAEHARIRRELRQRARAAAPR